MRAGGVWWTLCGAAVVLAIAAQVGLEIARHRQYLRHRDSGFVPGTQHWVLGTAILQVVLLLVGLAFALVAVVGRHGG